MKLLTMNTHSLLEADYPEKLDIFVDGILRQMPDLIAMQEVNQTIDAPQIDPAYLEGQFPSPGYVVIREDNHAAQVVARLRKAGVRCSWTWMPIKRGYDIYDEGVALISLGRKIRDVDGFPVSKCHDYENWRTRKVLGVRLEGMDDWFYSVHMGWWNDPAEPFLHQWTVLNSCIASKRICDPVWLMGDFNAPTCFRGESYDTVSASGWYDTFTLAEVSDEGITVPGVIDGWHKRMKDGKSYGMRLDQIWCSQKKPIRSSSVLFNGINGAIVSDHFAVMIESCEEDEA